jgi:LPXTG-site transpeptidase (sortase) family protein
VIEKYGVDAPLVHKKVYQEQNVIVMPNPDGPDDVVYYDFSEFAGLGGAPGRGGNSVFAGHVDWSRGNCKNGTVSPPCEAVFWHVNDLRPGDEVDLVVGGQNLKYRVVANHPVHAETGDWFSVVAAREQESITLITCSGDFNRQTREYSHRQVVVAIRI